MFTKCPKCPDTVQICGKFWDTQYRGGKIWRKKNLNVWMCYFTMIMSCNQDGRALKELAINIICEYRVSF